MTRTHRAPLKPSTGKAANATPQQGEYLQRLLGLFNALHAAGFANRRVAAALSTEDQLGQGIVIACDFVAYDTVMSGIGPAQSLSGKSCATKCPERLLNSHGVKDSLNNAVIAARSSRAFDCTSLR